MQIWIDADGCPRDARLVTYRASARLKIPVALVANVELKAPGFPLVTSVRVPHGFDEADAYIAAMVDAGDIVITADIPLAAQIVERGAIAIGPRGKVYDERTVHQRLATRNLMEQLRSGGFVQGGPGAYGAADKQKFAAALDRELTRRLKTRNGGR